MRYISVLNKILLSLDMNTNSYEPLYKTLTRELLTRISSSIQTRMVFKVCHFDILSLCPK